MTRKEIAKVCNMLEKSNLTFDECDVIIRIMVNLEARMIFLNKWLKEKDTFYIDNQGIHYNTIQVNEVIRKVKELMSK